METEEQLQQEYEKTVEWLYRQLPEFSRIGAVAYKPGLENIISLCAALGDPHLKFKSIHIGGTNGKGSCSSLLAGVFQSSGYKTGLYTSPHITDYRERIRIDGAMIGKDWVVHFVEKIRELATHIRPSFFEISVAMAFAWFATQKVDIAVIEVGLGGALDSTNIILPELSVITNISIDHTNLLGNTLAEIAIQKAGIIKSGIPVIIGETQPETEKIFVGRSVLMQSPVLFADQVYSIVHASVQGQKQHFRVIDKSAKSIFNISTDLLGAYQAKNMITVLATLEVLKNLGWKFPFTTFSGLYFDAHQSSSFRGRYHKIRHDPAVILDVSHNEAGIAALFEQVQGENYQTLFIITGFVKDKDINGILKLFPATAKYFFADAGIPRALPGKELEEKAAMLGLNGDAYPSITTALASALKLAGADDLVLVTGSFYILAEAYHFFEKNLSEKKSS